MNAPPSRAGLAIAITSLAVLAGLSVLGPAAAPLHRAALFGAAALLALVAWRVVSAPARAIAVLVAALIGASSLGVLWQPAMAVALVAYGLVAWAAPSARPAPAWRARGTVPPIATLLVAGVTPFALVGWLLVAEPDLGDVLGAYVPDGVPLPLLIAGGVAFALVNAALEELVWRGVLHDRLEALAGPAVAIALSAASFGLAHAHGVPRGPVGVVLAGSWAVMLSLLRRRSRGLLAPFVAHVVADATIAVIVLALVPRAE